MSRKGFFYRNGLSVVLLLLFLATWAGLALTGFYQHNQQQREHGQPEAAFAQYLCSGDFLEATTENWESEFLQMFAFVLLTAMLYQKGSAESKWPEDEAQEKPEPVPHHQQPWPVRRGGWWLKIYEHSLSLTFLLLFLLSFIAHGFSGAAEHNQEQAAHGQPTIALGAYFLTSRFWYESFQNWQSEFLSVFAMVVVSIWLREKDSPESKRVEAPHEETGA